jgi:hypothetical protein
MPTAGERNYSSKLKRAQHHVNNLRETFLADHNAGRFRPDVQPNANAPSRGLEIRFRVPDELLIVYSLIAGDAVQTLRATLDHLAYALAGKKAGGHTQFPIFSDVAEFAQQGVPRLAGMSDPAKTAIEGLQPYHAGQQFKSNPLWKINRMSNIDKHRLLNVVGLRLSGEKIREVERRQDIDPTMHAGYTSTGPLVDSTVKRTIPPPPPGMNMQYDYSLHLSFKEVQPAVGSDALQLLAELLRAVEDVVALLEPEIP